MTRRRRRYQLAVASGCCPSSFFELRNNGTESSPPGRTCKQIRRAPASGICRAGSPRPLRIVCKQGCLRRDIGSVAWGVAVVVAQAAARVKRKRGKNWKSRVGSPLTAYRRSRLSRRSRRSRRLRGLGRASPRPRVSIVVLFLAYELVALARCACGLWRREKLE